MLADPRFTRPRPLSLLGIALCFGAAGFTVARASLDVDRAAAASHMDVEAATGAEMPSPIDDVSASDDALTEQPLAVVDPAEGPDTDAGALAAAVGDVGDVGDAVGTEATNALPEAPSGDSAAPPPTSGTPTRLEMGRVAYIRCEGAPDGACPRDVGLERRAWDAIRGIERCDGLVGALGEADLRIVFDGGRYSGIGFRDFDRNALDTERLRTCVEASARELRTTHPASRLTVAFRFSLVR